jgi:hypothetical protein
LISASVSRCRWRRGPSSFRKGEPINLGHEKLGRMFACAEGLDFSCDLIGGALCRTLGGFGFHVGHRCPRDPIRHPAPATTTEEIGSRLDARLKQEAQRVGAVLAKRISKLVDLPQHGGRDPQPHHGGASGARATTFFAPFRHEFWLTQKRPREQRFRHPGVWMFVTDQRQCLQERLEARWRDIYRLG